MSVILGISLAGMDNVGVDGLVAKGPGFIADHVRRVDQVTVRQSNFGSLGGPLRRGRGLEITRESWQRAWVAGTNGGSGRRQVVIPRVTLGIAAWVRAEVGRLVHIDPQAVNIDAGLAVEELGKLVIPVLLDVRVEPIGIRSHTRPDGTCTG